MSIALQCRKWLSPFSEDIPPLYVVTPRSSTALHAAALHPQPEEQRHCEVNQRAEQSWLGSAWAAGFVWTLYPFVDGKTGFEMCLSQPHWIVLGRIMTAVHNARLPAALAERVPQEDYSPRWRTRVRAFHNQVQQNRSADPIAAHLAAFWLAKRDEILAIVDRADQLAQALQQRVVERVTCHSDLHGRNVLIGANDEVTIVDWDEPILAAKERDLMFIGGGVGGIWNNDHEAAWFYQGYGPTEIDLAALCYYRYERIVADIAACAEQIFGMQGSVEERAKGLGIINQFLPNNVVDIAHRTYDQL